MITHRQHVKTMMRRPGVEAQVERIECDEGELPDSLLKACDNTGLSQAGVAERMATKAPAVARLERALAAEMHSPSAARNGCLGLPRAHPEFFCLVQMRSSGLMVCRISCSTRV